MMDLSTDAAELGLKPCEPTQHKKFQGVKLPKGTRLWLLQRFSDFNVTARKRLSKCTQHLKDKNSLWKVYLLGRKNPRLIRVSLFVSAVLSAICLKLNVYCRHVGTCSWQCCERMGCRQQCSELSYLDQLGAGTTGNIL